MQSVSKREWPVVLPKRIRADVVDHHDTPLGDRGATRAGARRHPQPDQRVFVRSRQAGRDARGNALGRRIDDDDRGNRPFYLLFGKACQEHERIIERVVLRDSTQHLDLPRFASERRLPLPFMTRELRAELVELDGHLRIRRPADFRRYPSTEMPCAQSQRRRCKPAQITLHVDARDAPARACRESRQAKGQNRVEPQAVKRAGVRMHENGSRRERKYARGPRHPMPPRRYCLPHPIVERHFHRLRLALFGYRANANGNECM